MIPIGYSSGNRQICDVVVIWQIKICSVRQAISQLFQEHCCIHQIPMSSYLRKHQRHVIITYGAKVKDFQSSKDSWRAHCNKTLLFSNLEQQQKCKLENGICRNSTTLAHMCVQVIKFGLAQLQNKEVLERGKGANIAYA